jgi:hypothetical protein
MQETLSFDVVLLTLQFCDFNSVSNASLVNREWFLASKDDSLWITQLQRTHTISNAQQKLLQRGTIRQLYINVKKQRTRDSNKRQTRQKLMQFRYKRSWIVHSSFTWLTAMSLIILSLRDVLFFRVRDAFVPLWLLLFSIWVYWIYIIIENIIISERKHYAVPITSGIVATLVTALVIMIYFNISRDVPSWFIVLFPIYSSSFSFTALLLALWRDRDGDFTFIYLALCFSCISVACLFFSIFYKRTGILILTFGNFSAIRACKKTSFKNYDVIVMEFFISLIVCQLSLYFGMEYTSLVWSTGVIPIYLAHRIFLEAAK